MSRRDVLVAALVFTALYLTAVLFRPVLAIDETRYLTVAWEMWLRGDWLAPLTVNFEPYHHKPPLLFWLINLSWAVFGVSRWAATIPPVLAGAGCVALSVALCRSLFPRMERAAFYVLLGSFPLALFSSLVLFDLTVAVFVLGALLGWVHYARSGQQWLVPVIGLCLGLGVLTKGPVAYLYVLFPVLLAPLWTEGRISRSRWYAGAGIALLVSLVPIAAWVVPVIRHSSGDFAYWLLWEQTAGRVAGSFEAAHPQPPYFYLPVLAIMCLPWLFFAAFWRGWGRLRTAFGRHSGLRFLAAWLLPTVLAFSLIGGKQAHYMVPLLPGIAMLIAWQLQQLPIGALRTAAVTTVAVVAAAQALLPAKLFSEYDLQPVADVVSARHGTDLAFIRIYRGEIGFLARLEQPVDVVSRDELGQWFSEHPGGLAIASYQQPRELSEYELQFASPYRGKHIGIFSDSNAALASAAVKKP